MTRRKLSSAVDVLGLFDALAREDAVLDAHALDTDVERVSVESPAAFIPTSETSAPLAEAGSSSLPEDSASRSPAPPLPARANIPSADSALASTSANSTPAPELGSFPASTGPNSTHAPESPEALRVRELGSFPAYLVATLPAPATFLARIRVELPTLPGSPSFVAPSSERFVVTTSQRDYAAARARGLPVFHGGEWNALVEAAEQDRGGEFVLHEWLTRKRTDAGWFLVDALGGIAREDVVRRFSVADVLRAFGSTLEVVSDSSSALAGIA